MDRTLGGNNRNRLILLGTAPILAAIVVVAWQNFIAGDGASYMSSDSETTSGTTTGTTTESCVIGMIAPAPEDSPLPTDKMLNPNAYARIVSDQEAIAVLKKQLAHAPNCAERELIRGHIEMHRISVAHMRGNVVPIRPPYNYD